MGWRSSGLSSFAGCSGTGEPARFCVPHRRLAEEPAVLPIELACTFIADLEGGACGIQAVIEHALSGYMQTKLLLVLKGAHRGERTKLMVQRRYTHPRHGREFLNAQGPGVVHPEPLDCLRCPMALLSQGCDGAEMLPLRATKQSVDDLTLDQAAEEWNVLRRIEKVYEPGTCTEEFYRSNTYRHAANFGRLVAQMKLLLGENLPDRRHFEFEHQSQHWLLFRCGNHLADDGQIDRSQEEVRAVAQIGCFADIDALLSLHEDNQTGFVRSRGACGGCGTAVESQTRYLSERIPFRNGTIGNLAGQLSPHLRHPWFSARILVFRPFHPLDSFKPS